MGVVAITGATGALGSATATALVQSGASVLLLSRPSARLIGLRDRLWADGGEVEALPVDLSVMASVRGVAERIAKEVDRLDALIHTAAVFHSKREETVEGFETMLATNHLGPFLLTNLLKPRFDHGGRVLWVTAPSTTPVDLRQMNSPYKFRGLTAFGATKAANLMTTFELGRRAENQGIYANAFHPGVFRSHLMRQAAPMARLVSRLLSRPPERAATALVELATSPDYERTTGQFFKATGTIEPPESTMGRGAQLAFWEETARLVGLTDGF
jgi:NAD(P)-dependent dehydrogenase (short-subunit alcohol dehydrogenase family)